MNTKKSKKKEKKGILSFINKVYVSLISETKVTRK